MPKLRSELYAALEGASGSFVTPGSSETFSEAEEVATIRASLREMDAARAALEAIGWETSEVEEPRRITINCGLLWDIRKYVLRCGEGLEGLIEAGDYEAVQKVVAPLEWWMRGIPAAAPDEATLIGAEAS